LPLKDFETYNRALWSVDQENIREEIFIKILKVNIDMDLKKKDGRVLTGLICLRKAYNGPILWQSKRTTYEGFLSCNIALTLLGSWTSSIFNITK